MSKISLKNFVDINIQPKEKTEVIGTRDTVVLYTSEISTNPDYNDNKDILVTEKNYETYCAGMTNTLEYLAIYFDNGGVKALIKQNVPISAFTAGAIKDLDDEYIVISYVTNDTNNTDYSAIKEVAINLNNDESIYGINEKLILTRTTTTNNLDETKNFIVKYSNVTGAEMTIAAYLSKINVYKSNSIFDYAFTTEKITPEKLTNEEYQSIINNNMNVDIELANAIRNCGGNCKDGKQEITNNYVRILLHQTLTQVLINLLAEKIKDSTGVAKIYTTICSELDNYLLNGYLTTDKVWTSDDYVVDVNNETYTIIEKGTPLLNGYNVTVLPLSSLTEEEKKNHQAPNIYIIIGDQYGIRKIHIDGNVI